VRGLKDSGSKNLPRMTKKIQSINIGAPNSALRVGFVPLTDCAPVVMAHELRLFRKYGLRVTLHRELGWATIRDKVIHRELDAAHAIASMPVAATLGLGSIVCECVSGIVLNLNGNAITLSAELWRRGIRDGAALREEIRSTRGKKMFTFGAVYPFSSHLFLLRQWLSSFDIDPDRDVRIVIVPPPQMVANLKAGNLDGFCVGEPWNSVAVQARIGWCMAASAELEPNHPEKVLMVRRDFAEERADEHCALVAALLNACEYCQASENREHVTRTLARDEYVGASEAALRAGFSGKFDFGQGVGIRAIADFNIFHGQNANEPSGEKVAWVLQHMRDSGRCPDTSSLNFALGRRVFRPDIFEKALRLSTQRTNENETQSQSPHALV
jgi:ABC-type nitrate/sulfonate/bicarbonate transport system substrate-binding protein